MLEFPLTNGSSVELLGVCVCVCVCVCVWRMWELHANLWAIFTQYWAITAHQGSTSTVTDKIRLNQQMILAKVLSRYQWDVPAWWEQRRNVRREKREERSCCQSLQPGHDRPANLHWDRNMLSWDIIGLVCDPQHRDEWILKCYNPPTTCLILIGFWWEKDFSPLHQQFRSDLDLM